MFRLLQVAVLKSLPRNHYTESWYDSGQVSSEISRLTQRSYEPRNVEERLYDTSFSGIRNREEVYQPRRQTYSTPTRPEDLIVPGPRPRWYNGPENSPEKAVQQQQRQLLQVILQPEIERTDHYLTTPNTKLSYGFSRQAPSGTA